MLKISQQLKDGIDLYKWG